MSTKVGGLRLDPEIMQTAQDNEWALVVRPAALRWMDSGQPVNALKLVRERRGADGYPLLPAIEVEALERLGRVTEALTLAEKERVRAERRVDADLVRTLITAQARILERIRRWDEAWTLLEELAAMDRARRRRTDALDDDVRIRELVTLTSLLRIARHEKRLGGLARRVLTNMLHITRLKRRPGRPVDEITRETVDLAEATPRRLLTASPSLLRDLAAEIGANSPQILQLAVAALANPSASTISARPDATDVHVNAIEMAVPGSSVLTTSRESDSWSAMFREASDASQDYLRIPLQLYVGVIGDRSILQSDSTTASAIDEALGLIEKRHRTGIATPVGLTVISVLTEGSEQIAVQRALARVGARLEAILPLPVDDYLEDFASDTSKNQFYALLDRATDIRHMPEGVSRSEAYELAGREIVDRCDVLLAIWDGSPSQRGSGLADVISYASICRVPVLLVSIVRSHDGEIHSLTINDRDLPDILGPLSAEAFADFDEFNARSLDTVGKSVQQRLMPSWASDAAIPPNVQRVVDYAQPYFTRADQIARSLERLFLLRTRLLYALPAAVVVIVATQVIFFSHDHEILWAAAVALVARFVILIMGRRARWEDRWLAAQYLTERIRAGVIMLAMGVTSDLGSVTGRMHSADAIKLNSNREWAERAFVEIFWRAPALVHGDVGLPRTRELLGQWLEDSIKSHEQASRYLIRHQSYLTQVVRTLFAASVLAALCHTVNLPELASEPGLWVYLTIVLPTIAIALYGYGTQRGYASNAERSRRMVKEFSEAQAEMADAVTLAELKYVAREVELVMWAARDRRFL